MFADLAPAQWYGMKTVSGRMVVTTFAFNVPQAFIETNIRSVFLFFFFPEEKDVPDSKLYPLIEESLDRDNPRDWYYALMDYGADLKKKVGNPNRKSRHYAKQSKFEGSGRPRGCHPGLSMNS